MTRGYKVKNALTHNDQIVFVVSNYPVSNVVATRGFFRMPEIDDYDIGVWKIKKLKV